jgi:hypothetical protein
MIKYAVIWSAGTLCNFPVCFKDEQYVSNFFSNLGLLKKAIFIKTKLELMYTELPYKYVPYVQLEVWTPLQHRVRLL